MKLACLQLIRGGPWELSPLVTVRIEGGSDC